MNNDWKKAGTVVIFTVISISMILVLPKYIVDHGLLTVMIGMMMSPSVGEMPSGTGNIGMINKVIYWMFPAAYLLIIIYFISLQAGLFYIAGFTGVHGYRILKKKESTIIKMI